MDWDEYRIFIRDPEQQRLFITNIIPKLLSDLKEDEFFFIRYWEGGPHIRLRIRGERDDLTEAIRQLAQTINAPVEVDGSAQPSSDPALAFGQTPSIGNILRVIYKPETTLYGVGKQLEENERFFVNASRLAVALLEALDFNQIIRLAVDIFIATIRCASLSSVSDEVIFEYDKILKAIGGITRPLETAAGMSDRLLRQARSGKPKLDSPVGRWEEWLRDLTHSRSTPLILAMHIHLFMNRLGISPLQEARLMSALLKRNF